MADAGRDSFYRVYRLGLGRLLLLPIVWGVIVTLLIGAALSTPAAPANERAAFLGTAAIFTLIMLPFVWITWRSRLVLTSEGIAHHQLGYTVRSTWSNLEALHLEPGCEALYLREPGTRSVLLRVSASLVGGAGKGSGVIGDPNMLAQGRSILLFPFMQHWQRGPLREDLQRHAPQLFPATEGPGQV